MLLYGMAHKNSKFLGERYRQKENGALKSKVDKFYESKTYNISPW
jgi:hypothetical protein